MSKATYDVEVKDAGNELVSIQIKDVQPLYFSIEEAGDLIDKLWNTLAQMVAEKELRRIATARV